LPQSCFVLPLDLAPYNKAAVPSALAAERLRSMNGRNTPNLIIVILLYSVVKSWVRVPFQ